jgi:uncharacterized LabA/DUF88 family protein
MSSTSRIALFIDGANLYSTAKALGFDIDCERLQRNYRGSGIFVDPSPGRVKGSMDIELAVDAMELAGQIDQMILFSGDGDFRSVVAAVQRRGVRVTVVSTIATQPPMIADELRRKADVFIDLRELQPKINRDPSGRPTPREA